MIRQGVALRRRPSSVTRARLNPSLVGSVATLVVALICAIVVLHALSNPSISLGSIAVVVIGVVGGLGAITMSLVMLMAGVGYRSAKR